ncbi:MAG: carboxypeptidase regulatory-like domain-containing protein [Kofleriaceae bacterium]|nr:carboxypeptidase regulatory-like domain-containing protein [Kofleriaceae bacterium]
MRDCRLGPAVQVAPRADAELRLRDLDERPATVEVAWAARPGDEPVVVARAALPVVGHEVAVPLRPWATRLTSDATGDDAAWVITPPTPYVAVTDDAGAAVLTDVPAGTYRVRAWLRPGAGQAAREAAGEVTIAAGADATLTLSLADAAGPADDASATGAAADDDDDDDP